MVDGSMTGASGRLLVIAWFVGSFGCTPRATTSPKDQPVSVQNMAPPPTMSDARPEPQPVLLFATLGKDASKLLRTELPEPEQEKLLTRFVGEHLANLSQCTYDGTDLSEARRLGQFAPSVEEILHGPITEPAVDEQLYIVKMLECGATHADNWGTTRLYVAKGDLVVANVEYDTYGAMAAMDVDSDGVLEIVFSSGFMSQGVIEGGDSLVSLRHGHLRVLKDFGQTRQSTCGAMMTEEKEDRGVIVHVTPGLAPVFQIENVVEKCAQNVDVPVLGDPNQ